MLKGSEDLLYMNVSGAEQRCSTGDVQRSMEMSPDKHLGNREEREDSCSHTIINKVKL